MRLVSVSVVGCAVGEGFAIALGSLSPLLEDLYQDLLPHSLSTRLILRYSLS